MALKIGDTVVSVKEENLEWIIVKVTPTAIVLVEVLNKESKVKSPRERTVPIYSFVGRYSSKKNEDEVRS